MGISHAPSGSRVAPAGTYEQPGRRAAASRSRSLDVAICGCIRTRRVEARSGGRLEARPRSTRKTPLVGVRPSYPFRDSSNRDTLPGSDERFDDDPHGGEVDADDCGGGRQIDSDLGPIAPRRRRRSRRSSFSGRCLMRTSVQRLSCSGRPRDHGCRTRPSWTRRSARR
jgi:hypothetical protein